MFIHMAPPKPLLLMILDGFGIAQDSDDNAVRVASTPNIDRIMAQYPNTRIVASGTMVGLPEGQMGNSEVGHLNLGAGRVVYQDIMRINNSIKTGDFFSNPRLLEAIDNVKEHGTALHIMGLVSDGGVHSDLLHLFALLEMAHTHSIKDVFVHVFLDGRDVPPKSAVTYIRQLEKKMEELGTGRIATVSGRYYAMDRDNRWERVQLAYDAITLGAGKTAPTAEDAVLQSYEKGENDEFVRPTVIGHGAKPPALLADHDSVIFFNFRSDRARELTRAMIMPDFSGFAREAYHPHLYFASMTEYDLTLPTHIIFPHQQLDNTLGEYLSRCGLRQLRIAETEKYAHVTFFFNGGVEKPNAGEDRVLIHSPKVATYDLKPGMSAYEVTDEVISKIGTGVYDVIILNFANCDMVGHTGDMNATVAAVEAVDECVGKVVEAVISVEGAVIITADHGNAEQMKNEEGAHTAHTLNDVPIIVVCDSDGDTPVKLRSGGCLADVAPTMLDILKLKQPEEMTGLSLIKH